MDLSEERRRLFRDRLRRACIAKYGNDHGIATYLGREMGVTTSTAAKWLRGKIMPPPERWGVLAATLGVTAAWLIGDSHTAPESVLEQTDLEVAENVGRAASIVYPLVTKLKPDASEDEIMELAKDAWRKLAAGEPVNAVKGDIATRLLED